MKEAAVILLLLAQGMGFGQTQAWPDLTTVTPDLAMPRLVKAEPAAGKRVRQTTPGWDARSLHHVLYLPSDWNPAGKHPVLVEFPGNGGYWNSYGDLCDGSVESCQLGYGISGGKSFIWICLPFVEIGKDGAKRHAMRWWGDVQETKRYCAATVRDVCNRYGGDADRVILCGFSRGSIACNFIGLHDDAIAKLWRAFVCHSHYDGVITKWPYQGADEASALQRLHRLNGRPQFISHEQSTNATAAWLDHTGVAGDWTLVPIPFRNHSDAWVLRDLPERKRLRDWIARVTR